MAGELPGIVSQIYVVLASLEADCRPCGLRGSERDGGKEGIIMVMMMGNGTSASISKYTLIIHNCCGHINRNYNINVFTSYIHLVYLLPVSIMDLNTNLLWPRDTSLPLSN